MFILGAGLIGIGRSVGEDGVVRRQMSPRPKRVGVSPPPPVSSASAPGEIRPRMGGPVSCNNRPKVAKLLHIAPQRKTYPDGAMPKRKLYHLKEYADFIRISYGKSSFERRKGEEGQPRSD